MPDLHANFAYSLVATAPTPAASGTSLVVTAGQGALFPTVPFNATVWPAGAQPLSTNAEIVRVTNISTDTFTITRTQESTLARTIVVGDQIAATVTAKTLTDAEITGTTAENDLSGDVALTNANTYYDGPSVSLAAGTWLVIGVVTVAGNGSNVTAKLWDSTTVESSAEGTNPATGDQAVALTVAGIVAPGSTPTYKVSVASSGTGNSIKAAAIANGAGNNASHIRAVRIA